MLVFATESPIEIIDPEPPIDIDGEFIIIDPDPIADKLPVIVVLPVCIKFPVSVVLLLIANVEFMLVCPAEILNVPLLFIPFVIGAVTSIPASLCCPPVIADKKLTDVPDTLFSKFTFLLLPDDALAFIIPNAVIFS